MSKTNRITAVALLFAASLALAGPPAWGQAEYGVDVRGGLATPIGTLNDGYNLGFGVHSSFFIEFSPVAAAGLGFGYNRFPLDIPDTSATGGLTWDGGNLGFFNVCPELRVMVGTGDMATFAGSFGMGYYRIFQGDIDVTDPNDASNNTTYKTKAIDKFGVNAAGKVVFPLSDNVKIGVEAMWHLVFTEEDTTPAVGTTQQPSGLDYNASFFNFGVVLVITTGT